MRISVFKDGWLFAVVAAAGVAIFFVVRLLLPTGESALPPLPIRAEPPAPVFSVALPAPPPAPKLSVKEPEVVVVARTVSRPVVAAPKAPVKITRKPAAAKPKPAPPAPAAPAPEPVRMLASVQPVAAPNPSPGRAKHGKPAPPGHAKNAKNANKTEKRQEETAGHAKHDKGAPPGHAKKAKKHEVEVAPEVVEVQKTSPGREKHDKGLPPGQAKKFRAD